MAKSTNNVAPAAAAKTPRKNAIVSVLHSEDGLITFNVVGAGAIPFNPSTLSDDVRNRAMVHGLVQKITDAAAISKSELTGDPATDAETKYQAMLAVADRLSAGEWRAARGDGSAPVAGVIYRAFREYVCNQFAAADKPAPEETATRALYDARDRAGQLALRTVPEIATIIERMKSERGPATSNVDTSALLADLGL